MNESLMARVWVHSRTDLVECNTIATPRLEELP